MIDRDRPIRVDHDHILASPGIHHGSRPVGYSGRIVRQVIRSAHERVAAGSRHKPGWWKPEPIQSIQDILDALTWRSARFDPRLLRWTRRMGPIDGYCSVLRIKTALVGIGGMRAARRPPDAAHTGRHRGEQIRDVNAIPVVGRPHINQPIDRLLA
jgi:hypothetical protein